MTDEDRPTSVVFDHCKNVYMEMLQQARQEEDNGLVYEGHLTKLITGDLGLATPRYTEVMRHLKTMGCVEQLRRGGASSPSRWRLVQAPDEQAFKSVEGMLRPSGGKVAVVEQQLRDLNRRVQALESEVTLWRESARAVNALVQEHSTHLQDIALRINTVEGVKA